MSIIQKPFSITKCQTRISRFATFSSQCHTLIVRFASIQISVGGLQGVPVSDAKEYVEKYFQRYPGVLDYMEATKAQAAADGYKPIAELIDPEA